MIQCPKCSSRSISGPRYESCMGEESLVYECVQCGYGKREPTHDNRGKVVSIHPRHKAFAGKPDGPEAA